MRLANALDATAPYLRTSLLPGLLEIAKRNLARGLVDLNVYELGTVFRPAGAALGSELTFLQFSSEVCTPCRRAAVVLGQLATERPGLAHVEIDVTEHLDLVRRFDVMRTPTVLVLDAGGVVVGRMSGALDRRHALAALESCPGTVSAR